MGSLPQLIRQTAGSGPEDRRRRELLQLLLVAARAKVETFRQDLDTDLAGPSLAAHTARRIPIVRVISYTERYFVAAQDRLPDLVPPHLDHALDSSFSFAEGPQQAAVRGWVGSLVQAGLRDLIDTTQLGESMGSTSFVVPARAALLRADVSCWKYRLEHGDLLDGDDTVVAYLLRTSVIDRSRAHLDDLVDRAVAPEAYVADVVRLWHEPEAEQ